jgi:hypothetical protein
MNNFQVKFDNERITNHGGYELIDRFANKFLKLYKIIENTIEIKKRKSQYDTPHLNYILLMANTLFPFRTSQLDYLKNDDYLKHKFDLPQLPDSETFRLHLEKFGRRNITQLKRILKKIIEIKKVKQQLNKLPVITIDIDSTFDEAYGKQQGVASSYKTKSTGIKYLHPIIATIFELDLMVNFLLRKGNVYTSNSVVHFVKQVLLIVPQQFHHKIVIRADAGFFSDNLLNLLEKYNIDYVIRAKYYGSFDELLRQIDHRKFAPKTKDVQFARDQFKLRTWKKARNFLIIKKKIYVDDKKELENKSQLQLPMKVENYYYEYIFIVFKKNETSNKKLLNYYCQRGSFENCIKEYKNGFGGDQITSEKFVVNYANMVLKLISYNVISLYKCFALKGEFSSKTIQTIRYFLIYIPGKLIKRGQGYYLSLIKNYKYITYYKEIESRVALL